jgi:hypothetical protein
MRVGQAEYENTRKAEKNKGEPKRGDDGSTESKVFQTPLQFFGWCDGTAPPNFIKSIFDLKI